MSWGILWQLPTIRRSDYTVYPGSSGADENKLGIVKWAWRNLSFHDEIQDHSFIQPGKRSMMVKAMV
jgi:hypothetical protein